MAEGVLAKAKKPEANLLRFFVVIKKK